MYMKVRSYRSSNGVLLPLTTQQNLLLSWIDCFTVQKCIQRAYRCQVVSAPQFLFQGSRTGIDTEGRLISPQFCVVFYLFPGMLSDFKQITIVFFKVLHICH
jgi:hypothetical protein